MPARVVMPEAWIASTIGRLFAAKRSASATCADRPSAAASFAFARLPSRASLRPSLGECERRSLRNQTPLLLGKRRVKVQHEGISIGTELRYDERNALCHQPGDEGDVARQPIELRHDHRTLGATCGGEGGGQLWPAVERVRALAALCLNELGCEGEPFRFGETPDRLPLGIDPEAGAPLPFGRDPVVSNGRLHDQTAYHRLPFG